MSTYEEFMIILTTASLIVAILNMKNSNYSAGLCIYCTDREKVIQECKNPIAEGNF